MDLGEILCTYIGLNSRAHTRTYTDKYRRVNLYMYENENELLCMSICLYELYVIRNLQNLIFIRLNDYCRNHNLSFIDDIIFQCFRQIFLNKQSNVKSKLFKVVIYCRRDGQFRC